MNILFGVELEIKTHFLATLFTLFLWNYLQGFLHFLITYGMWKHDVFQLNIVVF